MAYRTARRVESLVLLTAGRRAHPKNQQGYYDALGAADRQADSSEFVLLMLRLFVEALREAGDSSVQTRDSDKGEVYFDAVDSVPNAGTESTPKRDNSTGKRTVSSIECTDLSPKRDDSDSTYADFDGTFQAERSTFNAATLQNIDELHRRLSDADWFGRSEVIEILGGSDSRAGKLLRKMLKAGMIEPVKGHGKGRYRFKTSLIQESRGRTSCCSFIRSTEEKSR